MTWQEVERLLAMWRDAERRLATLETGSAEHDAATAEIERLRRAYLEAVERVTKGAGGEAERPGDAGPPD